VLIALWSLRELINAAHAQAGSVHYKANRAVMRVGSLDAAAGSRDNRAWRKTAALYLHSGISALGRRN
jgi:hypothetical protein